MSFRTIGVLGGMGPLATVDFMHKVIDLTGATRDQDHVPLIVHSVPQIPDRTEAIAVGSDEPFHALLAGVRALEQSGAELVVIPCNTAHAWFDRLAASTNVRLLHIAEAVRDFLDENSAAAPERIGLMATLGTVRAGFYPRYLMTANRKIVIPPPHIQANVTAAIQAVKAGDVARGRDYAVQAGNALISAGATRLLLACTELPIALEGTDLDSVCIDATACLARSCVRFSIAVDGVSAQEA